MKGEYKMYIIIEIQQDASGSVAIPPVSQRERFNDAEEEFHRIASVAAASSVYRHSVVLLEDNGFTREHASFEHSDM